jgi:hypothetical protein
LYGADGSLHAQLETDGPGVQASYMISSNAADATSVGLPSPFSSHQRLN